MYDSGLLCYRKARSHISVLVFFFFVLISFGFRMLMPVSTAVNVKSTICCASVPAWVMSTPQHADGTCWSLSLLGQQFEL